MDNTTDKITSNPICPVEHVYCDTGCAWWDADRNQCAMLTIAKAMHKEANKK